MTQKSFFWNGASIGDADTWTPGRGYHMANEDYESPWVDLMMRALLNGTGNRGVLLGWANELAVTGAASPIQVDTGSAIIYGLFYDNDAAMNVAVDTPTDATRVDRLVIRRDWAAQTARVTLLEGIEGTGAAPAMTQSPAPTGSGIYDIPLATVSITTGGVITLTDEREFCEFTTVPEDDSLATAHLVNEGADWESRETRTKTFMLGAGDLQPISTPNGYFDYTSTHTALQSTSAATWGAAAASFEGWQCAGAVTRYLLAAFKMPADYVPNTSITMYTWWIDDCGAALTLYIRMAYQIMASGEDVTYSATYSNTYINTTLAVDYPVRTQGLTISAGIDGDEIIYVLVGSYNAAGAGENILIEGVEIEYTGYL